MAPPCAGKMNQHTMASSKTNAAFGHTMVAKLWLDVAPACAGRDDDMFEGKCAAMRYIFAYELPKTDAWLAILSARNSTCREMRDAWF